MYSWNNIFYLPQWSQNTNSPCRQAVTACGYEIGDQDNWLITQHISRRVNGTLLPQVSIRVVFEFHGCDSVVDCRRTFSIQKWDTSTENSTAARETRNYRLVEHVATQESSQNRTIEVNFNGAEEGFYIAIRDQTTCISVVRLIVFYNVCPGGVEELVELPETIAPPVRRDSTPSTLTAQCVENAIPEGGGSAVISQCNAGGVWSALHDRHCSCIPGYNTSDNGRSCTCMLNSYSGAPL